jgi:triosephosphate isomerase
MQKLIAANWKENPGTERKARELFLAVAKAKRPTDVAVAVIPPFVYLEEVAEAFRKMRDTAKRGLALGVQDVFWEETGRYTGEVGPKMVKSLGVSYAIVGHSERRKFLHETDAMINRKLLLALRDGLQVILCVGEPLSVRKKGIAASRAFIKNQLKKNLTGVGKGSNKTARAGKLLIAYEPIWAIGGGKSDDPKDAAAMAEFIKKHVKASVLYGGSVDSKNVRNFVEYKSIDGALVGGASLNGKEFGAMIKAAGK